MSDRGKWKTVALLMFGILAILSSGYYATAVPALISFQGELRDNQDSPLEGVHRMVFRIFDDPLNGVVLWGEEQMVDVQGGIYNVFLGAGAKITSGDDLGPAIFSSGDRWMEISIENETLSPRQQISSVAFAFRAEEALYSETAGDAATLDGMDSVDFATSGHLHDGAAITSGTVAEPRIADSIARDSEIAWGNLSGIPSGFADGSDDGLANETDPTVTASVKDGITWTEIDNRPAGLDDGDQIGISTETDPQVGTNIRDYIPKWNGAALVNGSIYDNGNVGIGTINPLRALHIIGVSGQLLNRPSGMEAYESLIVENNNNNNIVLLARNNADSSLKFADDDHVRAGQIKYLHGEDRMSFSTNAIEQMNINDSGNVGIGTSTPSERLEVAGNVLVGSSSKGIKLRSTGTLADLDSLGADLVINNSSGFNTIINKSQGNVGIGTWVPEEKLEVSGNIKINGDLIVDGAVRGSIGDAGGAPFPRPAWGSGWIYYTQGECKTFNHNIGGDASQYFVDMQCKIYGGEPGQRFYGGVRYYYGISTDPTELGAFWNNLNATSIQVCRLSDDYYSSYIRIRIWMYN